MSIKRDEVLGGARVDLAAAVARIDEGAQADARDMARPVRGDVAEQVRDHALRQVVGLDLVGDGELLQLRHQAPMAADDALDQALMAEMIEPALLAVALAGGIDERQVARMPARRVRLVARGNERSSSATAMSSAKPMPTKPPVATRVAVADQAHRFGALDDLAFLVALRNGRAGWSMMGSSALPWLGSDRSRPSPTSTSALAMRPQWSGVAPSRPRLSSARLGREIDRNDRD